MFILLYWSNLDVSSIGPISLGTLVAPTPGWYFVCEGGGFMKRDGTGVWTASPSVSIGTNAPSYNNIIANTPLGLVNLQGRCTSGPTLRAIADGTALWLRVNTAGAHSNPPPRIDAYLLGTWRPLT